MDGPVDHNGHPVFGYSDPTTSPNSVDRFVLQGVGPHNHDSTCHDAATFGTDFLTAFSFDTVEPSTLQVSHTSHDDSCVDQCPGSFNSQGFPRGAFPPAPHPRPRFTTSSCSYPYLNEGSFLQNPSQHYEQTHAYFPLDSDIRFAINHGGRLVQHQEPSSGHHFSTALDTATICPVAQCDVIDECGSKDCTSEGCSEICSDPSCADGVCQGENCADLGAPCDNTQCLSSTPSAVAFDYGWPEFNHDWNFPQHSGHVILPHEQGCNHTNTEHAAAITLRHLRDPAATSQDQRALFNAFDGNSLEHGDTEVASTMETPSLVADTNGTSPVSHRPSLSATVFKDAPGQHICRWITQSKGESNAHICGQVFKCNEELHTHLGKDHVGQMSSKTKYLCMWEGCSRKADQVFASRNKLRRHISTHTSFKPFKCQYCQESFSAQQALDQHIRIHTGEKPYMCDYPGCDKAFKQKSALTMHKRTHTGEKPLMCDVCGKCFCESSNLSKHRKIHSADYKFKCPQCPRTFLRVDQLRRHQLKHDRDKEKGKGRMLEPSIPEDDLEADTLQIVNEQFLGV